MDEFLNSFDEFSTFPFLFVESGFRFCSQEFLTCDPPALDDVRDGGQCEAHPLCMVVDFSFISGDLEITAQVCLFFLFGGQSQVYAPLPFAGGGNNLGWKNWI